MQNAPTILGILTHQSQKKEFVFDRVYRHLFNPGFYHYARQQRQFWNDGGTRSREFGLPQQHRFADQVAIIIEQLRRERYDFASPTLSDNPDGESYMHSIIADIVAYLLFAICGFAGPKPALEPVFLLERLRTAMDRKNSEVYHMLGPDLSKYENGWHNRLMSGLAAKATDGRFLKLLDALVQAGYASRWTHRGTFSLEGIGSPLSEVCRRVIMKSMEEDVRSHFTGEHPQLFSYGSTMVLVAEKNKEVLGFSPLKKNRDGARPLWGYSIEPHRNHWGLRVDTDRQAQLLKFFTTGGLGRARGRLMGKDVPTLLAIYQAELQSWQQYFCIASNYPTQLRHFVYYHRSSLLATLAQKLDLSYQQIKAKCMGSQTPGEVCWLEPDGRRHRYAPKQRSLLRVIDSQKTSLWDGRGMADIDILPHTWERPASTYHG